MGFSLKNVFKKNEARGGSADFEEQESSSDRGGVEHRIISSEWPASDAPPIQPVAPIPSPFDLDGDDAAIFSGGSLATTSGLVSGHGAARELPPFDGRAQAPVDQLATANVGQQHSVLGASLAAFHSAPDPAAEPLPRSHDCQTAKELENRGFRPLSSASNPGEVPAVISSSMELSSNDQPSQHPQSNGGYHSPFGETGSGDGQPPFPPAQGAPDPTLQPMSGAGLESPGFGGGQLPSLPQTGPVVSPFESVTAPQVPSGSFPRVADQVAQEPPLQQDGNFAEAQHELPQSVLDDSRDYVEMNVLQLLGTVSPEELGASSQEISAFSKTRIPMAMLKPQLSSGQVFLNVSDIVVGCSPEHQSGMLGFRPDLRIKVPIGLIFPNVRAAEVTEPLPNPFERASASGPGSREGGQAGIQKIVADPVTESVPNSPEPSQITDLSASLPAGVENLEIQNLSEVLPPLEGNSPVIADPCTPESAADLASESQAAPETPGIFGSPLAALAPLGLPAGNESPPATGGQTASSPLPPMMPAETGESPQEVEAPTLESYVNGGVTAPAQAEQLPNAGGWPFEGGETNLPPLVNDVIESLEDLPPVSEDGDAIPPEGLGAIGDLLDDDQSTLRGVFLSGEKIDASRVAAHCSELPGIESCVILGNASKLVAVAPDSVAFAEEADRLHGCLLELIAATGVADSQRVTVRTDRNLVSFFAGEGFAIAVRHTAEGFRPGVQERLAIIARELGNLAAGQS